MLGGELVVKETETGQPGTEETLIDADVHEMLRAGTDLLPFLDPHWQRYITQYGWNHVKFPTGYPYASPLVGMGARLDWVLPDGTYGTELTALQDHLFEGERVTHGILNGFFHASAQPAHFEFAHALAQAYNDWQIAVWLDQEPRLFGSVHVVAHDPKAAAREIDRVGDHPQIVQVFLPTVSDRQYGDPIYHPIFEAAVRHNLVVALHHGPHTQTLLGYPRYYIEYHTLAAPEAAFNQLTSFICNGVFDKFPDLTLVLLETGVAWLPWLMWRLDQQYRELRVEVPWVKRLPSEHMRDHVRLSTQPMSDIKPEHFVSLVEMTDSDEMFLFSTDYPHYDGDSVDHVLASKRIPADLQRRIRFENAAKSFPKLRHLLPA